MGTPTPEWTKKISDMHLFDDGWNAVRDKIFANQKKLGVIPQDAQRRCHILTGLRSLTDLSGQ
jgi:hypothetical protein